MTINRDNVYNIDDVWCPGCDQPLAKRNKGCPFCGWKDPTRKRGVVQPMRYYFSVMAERLPWVHNGFICRVYFAGLEEGLRRGKKAKP